jgi:hypothetical protein
LLFFVDLINNPGFAYFGFILRAIIEKQENQDYSSKLEQITTIRKKEEKKEKWRRCEAWLPHSTFVHSTIALSWFTIECPIKFNKIRCRTNDSIKKNKYGSNIKRAKVLPKLS